MIKETLSISTEVGLHIRPASVIAKAASKFESAIFVEFKSKKVDAKSTLGLMTLGIKRNEEFIIEADGLDEKNAIEKLKEIIISQFQTP